MQGQRHEGSEMVSATMWAKVDPVLTETLVSMEEQRTAQERELIDQMKGTMKDNFNTCEDHLDRGVRTLDNNWAQCGGQGGRESGSV